ncbi:MAG TPA: S41 family peptidase [Candidatus Polarisedimenticolia bacterium]|nr:S41 family peptidase [Candidatus Polarisedimenticolia bacterium]
MPPCPSTQSRLVLRRIIVSSILLVGIGLVSSVARPRDAGAPPSGADDAEEPAPALDPLPFLEWLYPPTFDPAPVPRQEGTLSQRDWRQAIDALWGEGLPTDTKLSLFDHFWQPVDTRFACFQGLDVDWQALRDRYRPEIAAGVSRGRFAAIMNHMSLALRESHTNASDIRVSFQTVARPGVPVMYVGDWGFDTHFGACLTPLPDDSLLVYRTVPNHPLGLVPGDRVLGYDGRPWRELYQELLQEELPLRGSWWGSSPDGFDHSLMMAAGLNWHLFDVIDIARHRTGEITHQPTNMLDVTLPRLFCSEQLDIPGVPSPDFILSDLVRWGMVEGTHIGYIYVYGWVENVQQEFQEAVRALTVAQLTQGLIIDFRMNVGGNLFLSNAGLNLLFKDPTPTIAFAERSDPADHLRMAPSPNSPPSAYVINKFPDRNFYLNPIAVLIGPGAVSSGDQVALRMTFHPTARTFGKTTATAFNGPVTLDFGPDWFARVAEADAYRVTDPSNFLTHDEFVVDTPVWLTQEDVARGKDTVVEKAIHWIQNRSPQAAARAEGEVECQGPGGAVVKLDGSASADPDSNPGTNDGIATFEWLEDLGMDSEKLLGRGEILEVPLALGPHRVFLRVVDEFGLTDTAVAEIDVVDTAPPRLAIEATPNLLWPPDHRLVEVRIVPAAEDLCGGVTVTLVSVASNEPDQVWKGGAGDLPQDIQEAEEGDPDFDLRLRAERLGEGEGRAYALTYEAIDAAGNRKTITVPVVVPHDVRGGNPTPSR